jgi:hypothetical protein
VLAEKKHRDKDERCDQASRDAHQYFLGGGEGAARLPLQGPIIGGGRNLQ